VPPEARSEFAKHLATLGYVYSDETANPAYRLFLAANGAWGDAGSGGGAAARS
jgi:hypothetical protein